MDFFFLCTILLLSTFCSVIQAKFCFPSGLCIENVDSKNFGETFGEQTNSEGTSYAELIRRFNLRAGAQQTAQGTGPGASGARTGAQTDIQTNLGAIRLSTSGGSEARGPQTSSIGNSFTKFENGFASFGSEHSASASGPGQSSSRSSASLTQQQGKRKKRGASGLAFLNGRYRTRYLGEDDDQDIIDSLYDRYGSSSFGLSNRGSGQYRLSGKIDSRRGWGGFGRNNWGSFSGGRIDAYDRNHGHSSLGQTLSARSLGSGFSSSWGDVWSSGRKSVASSSSSAGVQGFGKSSSSSKVGGFSSRFGEDDWFQND